LDKNGQFHFLHFPCGLEKGLVCDVNPGWL
jgi:hypothetical protein